jgi:hypothetical protein
MTADSLIRLQGVLVLALVAGCSGAADVSPSLQGVPAAGSTAAEDRWDPVFVDLDGRELRPAQDPATKAVAVVFILRECPIANSYVPELNRLHEHFSSRGVHPVLIHADPDTTIDQARNHASEYQLRSPVVLDPRQEWVKLAGATVSPEAVVFSRTGEIVYRGRIDDQYVGLGKRRTTVTSHDLQDALEAVLAGQPVSPPRTEAVGCLIPKLSKGE